MNLGKREVAPHLPCEDVGETARLPFDSVFTDTAKARLQESSMRDAAFGARNAGGATLAKQAWYLTYSACMAGNQTETPTSLCLSHLQRLSASEMFPRGGRLTSC